VPTTPRDEGSKPPCSVAPDTAGSTPITAMTNIRELKGGRYILQASQSATEMRSKPALSATLTTLPPSVVEQSKRHSGALIVASRGFISADSIEKTSLSASSACTPVTLSTLECEKDDDDYEFIREDFVSEDEEEEESAACTEHRGDWNERFQLVSDALHRLDHNTSLQERIFHNTQLLELSQDFMYLAKTYGRIIISERYVENKTIKPINIGGEVGGEKYLVQNILFKFAYDAHGMLGSDYAAAKVAGNELKGLISYYNCGIRQLCVPLMALVDYMGFRLIAMSLLPLDSLIYGTKDAGRSVHSSHEGFNHLMRKACKKMNLVEHHAGLYEPPTKLWSAADLEGHIGKDGRLYLLDFSRTWPPAKPDKSIPGSHLYRLLRPEFVMSYPIPLCPDAYSAFIKHDPNRVAMNKHIEEATIYLTTKMIPKVSNNLAWMIVEAKEKKELEHFRLTEQLHSRGINIRYIGLLFSTIRGEARFQVCEAVLLCEAIARCVKHTLRAKLRAKMRKMKQPFEAAYRHLIVDYMNVVFGFSPKSEKHWNTRLKPQLKSKFSVGLPYTGKRYLLKKRLLNREASSDIDPLWLIFIRVTEMTALRFSAMAVRKFRALRDAKDSNNDKPFNVSNLEEVGERIKHMGIVTEAQGNYCFYAGSLEDEDMLTAEHFLQEAVKKYLEALNSNPNNKTVLRNIAVCLTRLLEVTVTGGKEMSVVHLNVHDSSTQKIDHYYQRAINVDRLDPYSMYLYAKFLWRCGRHERAEEYFLKSLEINPRLMQVLHSYGQFLMEKGECDLAERFYDRLAAINEFESKKAQAQAQSLRTKSTALANASVTASPVGARTHH